MPDDRKFWEEKFVDSYVLESKRSRYKKLLHDPKKRPKILDRLNHNADLDFAKAIELTGGQTFSEQLVRKLATFKLTEQCRLISDDPDLDGKSLPWKEAAELTADAWSGTIMICPPKPIVVYRAESPSKTLYLFV